MAPTNFAFNRPPTCSVARRSRRLMEYQSSICLTEHSYLRSISFEKGEPLTFTGPGGNEHSFPAPGGCPIRGVHR
jgi:hypothetical protein